MTTFRIQRIRKAGAEPEWCDGTFKKKTGAAIQAVALSKSSTTDEEHYNLLAKKDVGDPLLPRPSYVVIAFANKGDLFEYTNYKEYE